MSEKKLSSDAVEWANTRYIKGKPEREASLKEAGRQADLAQHIYDTRKKRRMSRERLAELSGLSATTIEDLEESDYDGDWDEAMQRINRVFHELDQRDQEKTTKTQHEVRKVRKSTRAELVSQVADKTGVTKKVVDEVLRSLIEAIRQTLKEDRGITIPELGTFSVVRKMPPAGVHLRTRTKRIMAAGKTPSFRPAKALKRAVNESK